MNTEVRLKPGNHMYNSSYDTITEIQNIGDLNNKLFATFTNLDGLDSLLEEIQSTYTIKYNKMFVLKVSSEDEYVVTYNVDHGNIGLILPNTILVHRKKETNTLYTINALNQLIKDLNGGVADSSYRVDWADYRNSMLLTNQNELKQLGTKIYKIIEV
jgi:hypothetical protein